MTYTLYHISQPLENAETGLTSSQVVYNIWSDDGRTIHIEPKMETIYALDADGDETDEEIERQCAHSILGLEWQLIFKAPGGRVEGYRSCFGANEDEALQDALKDGWNEHAWDDSKWFVHTDAFALELLAEAKAEEQVEED